VSAVAREAQLITLGGNDPPRVDVYEQPGAIPPAPRMYLTDHTKMEASLPPPPVALENIRAALARDLAEFAPAPFSHDGTLVVCGSGPSLPDHIDEIRAERERDRPIVAVKGAHDLLVKNGIEPEMFVSVEAKPRLENVQLHTENTIYFLSSRCDPSLFDLLKDRKVMLFHSYGGTPLPELSGHNVVGGGTTSGLRAITLGYLLGFKRFVLYGFDSCLNEKGQKRYDSDVMKPEQIVDRIVGGRKFLCNGGMALQADEFQEAYRAMPGITFDIKGDGLLAAIVAERKRLGKHF
jgi:uncharacterized Rossmann fold enzyme